MTKKTNDATTAVNRSSRGSAVILIAGGALFLIAVVYAIGGFAWFTGDGDQSARNGENESSFKPEEKWLKRAYLIDALFHKVYTAGWEGANGAIGDAHIFAVTRDSSLLRFHTVLHPMKDLFNGTWVDDRAWAALAELYW
ncbi:MAG: hypothetical protein WC824_09280, partial [Bacteroidota bacterium]